VHLLDAQASGGPVSLGHGEFTEADGFQPGRELSRTLPEPRVVRLNRASLNIPKEDGALKNETIFFYNESSIAVLRFTEAWQTARKTCWQGPAKKRRSVSR
jgi:hypothetical protein